MLTLYLYGVRGGVIVKHHSPLSETSETEEGTHDERGKCLFGAPLRHQKRYERARGKMLESAGDLGHKMY